MPQAAARTLSQTPATRGADPGAHPARRYAALMGASLELNRLTGLVLDSGTKQMFTSVYSVAKGMLEDPVDLSLPRDNVRLQRSPCGCLYTINVDESYNANFMTALHCGRPDTDSTKVGGAAGLGRGNGAGGIGGAQEPGQGALRSRRCRGH